MKPLMLIVGWFYANKRNKTKSFLSKESHESHICIRQYQCFRGIFLFLVFLRPTTMPIGKERVGALKEI